MLKMNLSISDNYHITSNLCLSLLSKGLTKPCEENCVGNKAIDWETCILKTKERTINKRFHIHTNIFLLVNSMTAKIRYGIWYSKIFYPAVWGSAFNFELINKNLYSTPFLCLFRFFFFQTTKPSNLLLSQKERPTSWGCLFSTFTFFCLKIKWT